MAVSSALEGLTAEFGMGSGVSPPLEPPGNPNPELVDGSRFHSEFLLAISFSALG